MSRHLLTATALGCALAIGAAIGAGPVRAAGVRQDTRPATLPPPGYEHRTWVDSRGCTFFRASTGTWMPALDSNGAMICGPKPPLGQVSALTGFPVPPGYRVAWQDGRLNPIRGPLGK